MHPLSWKWKWTLKAGTGKYLVRCFNCLSGAVAPNFAFASAATPNGNPLAQWTITKAMRYRIDKFSC